jgi:myo-inositol-1(or 4)-monophosphatase
MDASGGSAPVVDTGVLLGVLYDGVRAVGAALAAMGDAERRRPSGRRGQYELDLVADEAIGGVLRASGLAVLSEESGLSEPLEPAESAETLLAVVDPVDGSTNAAMGLPWFATSVCVLDGNGPLAAVVGDQASGTRYEAVRGKGARCDGITIAPSGCQALASAVVGISGVPAAHPGWAQFRALGAASLDMCAVAAGNLDGYRVVGGSTLRAWDYLGALLVLQESGASTGELDGKELVVRDGSPRRPVAAATPALLADLASAQL